MRQNQKRKDLPHGYQKKKRFASWQPKHDFPEKWIGCKAFAFQGGAAKINGPHTHTHGDSTIIPAHDHGDSTKIPARDNLPKPFLLGPNADGCHALINAGPRDIAFLGSYAVRVGAQKMGFRRLLRFPVFLIKEKGGAVSIRVYMAGVEPRSSTPVI